MSLTETISQIEQLSPEDFKSLKEYLEKRDENGGILYKVRDGWTTPNQQIWWLSEDGPEPCIAGGPDHVRNVLEYPSAYSIARPNYRIVYED